MAKKSKRIPSAREAYDHAMRFMTTDGYLRTHAFKEEALRYYAQLPGAVLSSFSSELLLKTLLILEGKGHKIPGHNLKALYGRLNASHRAEIKARWDADQKARKADIDAAEKKFKQRIPRDLATALSDCGSAFEVLRYVYEDAHKKSGKFYITFFPHAVRDTIRRITGWK